MIYLEFKNKRNIGFKKLRYARVIARIIREMIWVKRAVGYEDPEAKIDYKIIFND